MNFDVPCVLSTVIGTRLLIKEMLPSQKSSPSQLDLEHINV
jgi:hypothetical protein